jgi:uncharacterized protein (TIGR02453 family)
MDFKHTLKFLSDLTENNNKPWFDENRKRYEIIKSEWSATVLEVIDSIAKFDSSIGELEPKNCVFRINRDVRFSKNKSPYKNNISAIMSKGGKKSGNSGYYIHVGPTESFIAGGIWMPEAPELLSIRQEIDYHFDEFKSIVEDKVFLKTFGALENEKISSIPKGFEKDNPAAEYLKYKSFVAFKKIDLADLADDTYVKMVTDSFKVLKPFNDFLNRSVAK